MLDCSACLFASCLFVCLCVSFVVCLFVCVFVRVSLFVCLSVCLSPVRWTMSEVTSNESISSAWITGRGMKQYI